METENIMDKEIYSGSGSSLSEIVSAKDVVYFYPHKQLTVILQLEQLLQKQFEAIKEIINIDKNNSNNQSSFQRTENSKQRDVRLVYSTYVYCLDNLTSAIPNIKKQLPLFENLDFAIFDVLKNIQDFSNSYNNIIKFNQNELPQIIEEFNWVNKLFETNIKEISEVDSIRIYKFNNQLKFNIKNLLDFSKKLLTGDHRLNGITVILNKKYQKKYVYNKKSKLKRLKLIRSYDEPTFARDATAFFDTMYQNGVFQSCYTTLTSSITNKSALQAEDDQFYTEFIEIINNCALFIYNKITTLLKFNDKSEDIEQIAQKYKDLGKNKFERINSQQRIKLIEYQLLLKNTLKNLSYKKKKEINLIALKELATKTNDFEEILNIQIISILFFNDKNLFKRLLDYYTSGRYKKNNNIQTEIISVLNNTNQYYSDLEQIIQLTTSDAPLYNFESDSSIIIFNVIGEVFQEYKKDQFSSRIFDDVTKEIIPTVPIHAYLGEYLMGYLPKKDNKDTINIINDYNEVIQKLNHMNSMYILIDGQNEEYFKDLIQNHKILITTDMIKDLIENLYYDNIQVTILEKILILVKNCELHNIPVLLVSLEDLDTIKESTLKKLMNV